MKLNTNKKEKEYRCEGGLLFNTYQEAKDYIKEHELKNKKIQRGTNGFRIYEMHDSLVAHGYSIHQQQYSFKPYLRIAKDLCYPESVLEKIRNTKTEKEVSKIMADARHGFY